MAAMIVLSLTAAHAQQQAMRPSTWLENCTADGAQLLCAVRGNITLLASTTGPAAVRQHMLVSGDASLPGTPTLELSGSAALFSVAANASVTFRNLRIASALLVETFPLPASSFLSMRAFTFVSSTSAAQPTTSSQPRLRLQDVTISSRSCRALALNQQFACITAPSANFTVTPQALRVWSYTSLAMSARNVTLDCDGGGTPLPYPCTAYVVNSPTELLAALMPPSVPEASSSDYVDLSAPINIFINRSMALRDAWEAGREGADGVPLATAGVAPRPTISCFGPVVIAGVPPAVPLSAAAAAALGAAPADWAARLSSPAPASPPSRPTSPSSPSALSLPLWWDGFPLPPTVLDLADTASLLALVYQYSPRVELHNLTLINPPLGPPKTYPSGFLALPLWTFDYRRNIAGSTVAQAILVGRNLAVALEAHELAMLHSDTTYEVPPELAGCMCAVANGVLLTPGAGYLYLKDKPTPSALPLAGGALFLPRLQSKWDKVAYFSDLLLLPPAVWRSPSSPPPPQLASPASPAQPPSPQQLLLPAHQQPGSTGDAGTCAAASDPGGSDPGVPPMCQLRQPFSTAPVVLNYWVGANGYGQIRDTLIPLFPSSFERSDSQQRLQPANATLAYVLNGHSQLFVNLSFYDTFAHVQSVPTGPTLLLGDPLGPCLVHMRFVTSAFAIRGDNDSLALRQVVLAGLAPAGMNVPWAAPPPPRRTPFPPPPPLHQPPDPPGRPDKSPPPPWPPAPRVRGRAPPPPPPSPLPPPSAGSGGARVSAAGTGCSAAGGRRRRRRVQQTFLNALSAAQPLGSVSGTGLGVTGGLPAGLANFTSCLWVLDFDRTAPPAQQAPPAPPPSTPPATPPSTVGSGGGGGSTVADCDPGDPDVYGSAASAPDGGAPVQPLPHGYLDSVVLLLPPRELSVLTAAWAEHLASAGGGSGSGAAGESGGEAGSTDSSYVVQAVKDPSAASAEAAAAAEGALAALADSLAASRLAPGATTTSLRTLTARMLALAEAQEAAAAAEAANRKGGGATPNTPTAPTTSPAGTATTTATTGTAADAADGVASDGAAAPGTAVLAFDSWHWCGLEGRNVTLAGDLDPSWAAQPGWRDLWYAAPLTLHLTVVRQSPPPPPGPPGPPSEPAPRYPEPDGADAGTPNGIESSSPSPRAAAPPPGPPVPLEPVMRQPPVPIFAPHSADAGGGGPQPESPWSGEGGQASSPAGPSKQPRSSGGAVPGAVLAAALSASVGTLLLLAVGVLLWFARRRWRGAQAAAAKAVSQPGVGAANTTRTRPAGGRPSTRSPRPRTRSSRSLRGVGGAIAAALTSVHVELQEVKDRVSTAGAGDAGGLVGMLTVTGANSVHGGGGGGEGLRRDKSKAGSKGTTTPTDTTLTPASSPFPPSRDGHSSGSAWAALGDAAGGGAELVVLGELGRGAQGAVFRGRWRGLDVAVKRIVFEQGLGPGVAAAAAAPRASRAITEAAISASLSHPNVVATYTHKLFCVTRPGAEAALTAAGALTQLSPQPAPPPPVNTNAGAGNRPDATRAGTAEPTTGSAAAEDGRRPERGASGLAAAAGASSGADTPAVRGLDNDASFLRTGTTIQASPRSAAGAATGLASGAATATTALISGAFEAGNGPVSDAAMATTALISGAFGAGKSGGGGGVEAEVEATATTALISGAFGVEAEVWQLTLVQELCDGGSLRDCLDSGVLARSRLASCRAGDEGPGLVPVPVPWGTDPREGEAGPDGAAPVAAPSAPVALLVCVQVARGLAYLHSLGVLHGDLSSANVLLKGAAAPPPAPPPQQQQQRPQRPEPGGGGLREALARAFRRGPTGSAGGGGGAAALPPPPGWVACGGALYGCGYVAKVCDFGLSGRLELSETHISGDARRSLLYSAPELVQYGTVSRATDVYAFAVLSYEIACGCSLPALLAHPQRGAGLRAWLAEAQALPGTPPAALPPALLTWPPGFPRRLVALFESCLAAEPSHRPGFAKICQRLERELCKCVQGLPGR